MIYSESLIKWHVKQIDQNNLRNIYVYFFFQLIHDLQCQSKEEQRDNNMGLLYRVGQDNLSILRELSLSEKLLNGLF